MDDLRQGWDEAVRDAAETPAERARFERRWRWFVGTVIVFAAALGLQAVVVFR